MALSINDPTDEFIPYLYLAESATLADLAAIAQNAGIPLVPKERYYYRYNDALRIIDFVQTKGVYDGWAVLVRAEDRPRATELLREHPELFLPFAEVEKNFLSHLPMAQLKQVVGSQHMQGIALHLAMQLLAERQEPITEAAVLAAQEAVRIRNAEQQPQLQWTTWGIWVGVILLAVLYLYLIRGCW